jgi:hypothetical protein
LTKTSILPVSETIVSIALLTDWLSVTSSCTTLIGSFSLSVANVFILVPFSILRAVAYVRKPFHAKVKEVSKPIPLELPVITATF